MPDATGYPSSLSKQDEWRTELISPAAPRRRICVQIVGCVYADLGILSSEGGLRQAFWAGQIRPVCDLAARMVKLRAVAITLLTTATFYDRIQNELKRNFNADDIYRMLYIRYAS